VPPQVRIAAHERAAGLILVANTEGPAADRRKAELALAGCAEGSHACPGFR
jgi:hypothetical protein